MAANELYNEYIKSIQEEINNSTDPTDEWLSNQIYYYFDCKYSKKSIIAWSKLNIADEGYNASWTKSDIDKFRLEAPIFCEEFKERIKEEKRKDQEIIKNRKTTIEVWGDIHEEFPYILDRDIRAIGRSLNVYKTAGNRYMWSDSDIEKLKSNLKNSNKLNYSTAESALDVRSRKLTVDVKNEIQNRFPNTSINEIRKIGHDNNVKKMYGNCFMWTESDIDKLKYELTQKEIKKAKKKRDRILWTILPQLLLFLFILMFFASL